MRAALTHDVGSGCETLDVRARMQLPRDAAGYLIITGKE
jgi:hypothetical protein